MISWARKNVIITLCSRPLQQLDWKAARQQAPLANETLAAASSGQFQLQPETSAVSEFQKVQDKKTLNYQILTIKIPKQTCSRSYAHKSALLRKESAGSRYVSFRTEQNKTDARDYLQPHRFGRSGRVLKFFNFERERCTHASTARHMSFRAQVHYTTYSHSYAHKSALLRKESAGGGRYVSLRIEQNKTDATDYLPP